MSMKKTDLVKGLAKKLEGRMKTVGVPPRFGQGSAAAAEPRGAREAATVARPVSVTCRLPADLARRLRERAVGQEGGVNTVIAQALEQWLAADTTAPAPASEPSPD
ncbi:hypothetical protein C7444_11317 [Sphaerotilus hippei]|uniref:Uncharacterized protein n=1 Tax=Sphaerotilus hippei TaxID=744406 RepID=A0A318GYI7_9BURK|nr:hypothetical protein [Sphaerotilus hippei]PXW94526.1 hypothetical protein C7444_11317 [Sphaerotilus hippei]